MTWDDRLAAAAQRHTQLMARRRQLSHDFPGEPALGQRLSAVPLDRSGENVGFASTIPEVNEGFMHSPPHRANILNPKYDAGGIGVVQSGGSYWVTEDFAHRIAAMSNARAEQEVIKALSRVRDGAGEPAIPIVESSRLHNMACEMARAGRLEVKPALALPGAHYAAVYTSTDLNTPPGDAQQLARKNASRIAAGACFARSSKYPSGVYWVVLTAFAK